MNRRSLLRGFLAGAMLAVAPWTQTTGHTKLSGVRRERLLNHRWVEAEGVPAIHHRYSEPYATVIVHRSEDGWECEKVTHARGESYLWSSDEKDLRT